MSPNKKVVIVGAGFGGLSAARALSDAPVDVTLIDRANHHLFQPLLYQVATAALSPADIACASRSLFSHSENVAILLDEVQGVDTGSQEVLTGKTGGIPYDYLVLATGADYSFFGRDDWKPFAPVLKTLNDALHIRERLLSAFEAAERSSKYDDVRRLLTFVAVGGGPTGVELAGAIAELAHTMLDGDFKNLSRDQVRILLIEAGPRILSAFTEEQSRYAADALRDHGVDVLLNGAVKDITHEGVLVGETFIETSNVFWAAGTQARPAGDWIGADTARNKGVIVQPDCSVPDHPNIFAIGDVACYAVDGKALPGLAPVAKQQGRYVGNLIRSRITGRKSMDSFRYHNWGTMAVIGRSKAVADFGWVKVGGFPAWLLWSVVHLWLLVSFRSRLTVYINWAWAWWTRGRGARLLTKTNAIASSVDTAAAGSPSSL